MRSLHAGRRERGIARERPRVVGGDHRQRQLRANRVAERTLVDLRERLAELAAQLVERPRRLADQLSAAGSTLSRSSPSSRPFSAPVIALRHDVVKRRPQRRVALAADEVQRGAEQHARGRPDPCAARAPRSSRSKPSTATTGRRTAAAAPAPAARQGGRRPRDARLLAREQQLAGQRRAVELADVHEPASPGELDRVVARRRSRPRTPPRRSRRAARRAAVPPRSPAPRRARRRAPAACGGPAARQAQRGAEDLPRQVEVGGDRGLGVVAARRQAVGDAQQRDVDLHRLAGLQVAVDLPPVQRPLVHEEPEPQVVLAPARRRVRAAARSRAAGSAPRARSARPRGRGR